MSSFRNLIKNSEGNIYIIAEACDNHMGSMEMARALARAAKDAGADAVKFQHHIAEEEMLRSAEMSDNFDQHLFDFLEENALSLSQHQDLKRFCDQINITYLCTPFSYKAATQIAELVPFFKIGSGEFQDHWYVDKLKGLEKPVIFSTGMCEEEELYENINFIEKTGLDFALLNCVSEYPPKLEDMNLGFIRTLVDRYPSIVIGHSDHMPSTQSSVIAASFGAKIIEKHLTLSHFIAGPDKDVSMDPIQFSKLCSELRSVNIMCTDVKELHDSEKQIRNWAYRSVVASRDIYNGEILDESCIKTKRPGTGIASKDYRKVLGKKLKFDVKCNTPIQWSDIR